VVRPEKLNYLGADVGIVATNAVDVGSLFGGRKIENGIEHGVDALESVVRGCAHAGLRARRGTSASIVGARRSQNVLRTWRRQRA
jgi:hypothetical protein